MRPPILRWKVSLALVGVVLVAVTLGSVLGPANQAPMARGTQFYTGWSAYTPHGHVSQHAIPIYSPANAPPQMRRRICAHLRDELPKTSKAFRRALERSMHDICKRR